MPDSNILFYIGLELAVLLLFVCLFLFSYSTKLKKLIIQLEEKIASLRQALSRAKKEAKKALQELAEKNKQPPKTFLEYLDGEIDVTRSHHQSLNPDRDIVLDITADAPIDRRVASLRHALLIAEKEARYAGDDDESNWEVLQSKLEQIIQFFQASQEPVSVADDDVAMDTVDLTSEVKGAEADDSEQIEIYKKRIENLERFKKLFFDMEGKWEGAKKQADDYHQQLTAMGQELGAGEEFGSMLDQYAKAFDDVGELIASASEGDTGKVKSTGIDSENHRESGVGKMVIANQDEMQRLRNMAVDQHKVITQLKKKLFSADSAEERQQVIEELSGQLDQQQRFLKEAETCTQLIEDELSRQMVENETLRTQLEAGGQGDSADTEAKIGQLQTMVGDFTQEAKQMLSAMATLEDENAGLQNQLEAGGDGLGAADAAADPETEQHVELLKDKLGTLQQELLNLQTQHIELEERYLELKMQ